MRRILAMTLLVALLGSSTTALAKAYDVADVLHSLITSPPRPTAACWCGKSTLAV
jgi:hypothetical protein